MLDIKNQFVSLETRGILWFYLNGFETGLVFNTRLHRLDTTSITTCCYQYYQYMRCESCDHVLTIIPSYACKLAQIRVFTSGKFPSNVVNFWDNMKLYSASEYSFTDIIDVLPLFS